LFARRCRHDVPAAADGRVIAALPLVESGRRQMLAENIDVSPLAQIQRHIAINVVGYQQTVVDFSEWKGHLKVEHDVE